eukprot:scaffold11398_cov108-Isochrysis_galbana.AAC.7
MTRSVTPTSCASTTSSPPPSRPGRASAWAATQTRRKTSNRSTATRATTKSSRAAMDRGAEGWAGSSRERGPGEGVAAAAAARKSAFGAAYLKLAVLVLVEALGGIIDETMDELGRLPRRSKGPGAVDHTRYGLHRSCPQCFVVVEEVCALFPPL